MKTIKILFSSIIILAILVFFAAPPLTGLWIKHHYTTAINKVNQQNPNLNVSVSHYQFGWFHSTANIHIALHLHFIPQTKTKLETSQSANTFQINAEANIRHGLIIYKKQEKKHSIHFALADIDWQIPQLNLIGHTIWRFNNTLVSQFHSPAFTLKTLSIQKLQSVSHHHLGTHHLQLQLAINSLNMASWLNAKNVLYQMDITPKALINYGKQKLTINLLKLNNSTSQPLTIDQLSARSDTIQKNNKIDMKLDYGMKSISKNSFDINSAQIDLAIKNIDANSLNKLLQTLQDQQNKTSPRHQYPQLIIPAINLLRHGLTIQINHITLKTTQGAPASLNGIINLPKLPKDTSFLQVLHTMSANFQIQAPKNWVKQQLILFFTRFQPSPSKEHDPTKLAIQTLQQWEKENWLISSEKNYKTKIQYTNGHLSINGNAEDNRLTPAQTDKSS